MSNLTIIRCSLALILKNQKCYSEAEPLLVDALANLEAGKTADFNLMASSLNALAVIRSDTGRCDEALELHQRSVRLIESALGSDHPSLVMPLNNLATTYVKCGRLNDASLTFQHAIDLCRKTLGASHVAYAVLLENYAVVLKKQGRKREAKEAEQQGHQIQEATDRRNGAGLTINVTALRSDYPASKKP